MANFGYFGARAATPGILLELIDHRGEIGVDVETVSLEDRTPLCVAMATSPDDGFYFPIDSPLLPWDKLQNPGIVKVFHNASYDVPILERYRGIKVANYVDTVIAAHTLGLPPKLMVLAPLLGLPTPLDITDLIGAKKGAQLKMTDISEDRLAEKCCKDAMVTIGVWQILKSKVPWKAFDLDMRLAPVLRKMTERGIRVDKGRLLEHQERLEKEVGYYYQIARGMGFNPGSPKQVAYTLRGRGHSIRYKRATGNPIMDAEMLGTVYKDDPVAQLVSLFRQSRVLKSTFVDAILEKHLVGDRLHPKFYNDVARTGRLSTSPNSQNIPVTVRDVYIPSDGCTFMTWDLSQIELRVIAFLSQDPVMLRIFAGGDDVHLMTARELGTERRLAKTLNYAISYLGDENTLYYRGGIPIEVGRLYIAKYFATFRGIAEWIQEKKQQVMRDGYLTTPYGRRRDFPEIWSPNEHKAKKALREAINLLPQGYAAEIMKEMMVKVDKQMEGYRGEYPMVNTVHDELDFDLPTGMDIPIPMGLAPFETPVEVGRGKNWKEAKV